MSKSAKYLAIETFYRELKKQFPERFLVTGSFANQAWLGQNIRPINDLDLLETSAFDTKKIVSEIGDFVDALPGSNDLVWIPNSWTHKVIFEESSAPGVRFIVQYEFKGETDTLQVDIAKLDPLTQPPVSACVPSFSAELLEIQTVPAETAAAWKLHGLFEHLDGRWLAKSLIDFYFFVTSEQLSTNEFRSATQMAFQSRLDPITSLDRLIDGNFGESKGSKVKWEDEMMALGLTELSISEVLTVVRDFLKPIFNLSHRPKLRSNLELTEHRVRLLHGLGSPEANRKLSELNTRLKVLTTKAYDRIGHLPGSKTSKADRYMHPKESARLTKLNDPESEIIVQEKLDGSCVAVHRRGRDILAIGREGDLTIGSKNKSRRMWADWVKEHKEVFREILRDGERLCGEWLAMAHATKYKDLANPFYAFDLYSASNIPMSYDVLQERLVGTGIPTPALLHRGAAISVEEALELLNAKSMPTEDILEGVIWRMEQNGRRKLIAKYVQHNFEPGKYLEEISGKPTVWHWQPQQGQNRYKQNTRLKRLMKKSGQVRVMGFDDSPHKRHVDTVIDIHGIVTNQSIFEGMVSGLVDANGLNASFVLADLILGSKFRDQIHAVLIDGITFAFNTVDLHALYAMTGTPVIAVMRHRPNMDKIYSVIDKYCDDPDEYKRLYAKAGTIFEYGDFFFQCCGLSEEQAHYILEQTTVNGNVPEPLRIAHLIGSSIKTGQSGNSA